MKTRSLRGLNRFRLMPTLGLAVLLPVGLIFINCNQLTDFKHDEMLEANIHGDLQKMLAIAENEINKKAYTMVEEARDLFPSPDGEAPEEEERLDLILVRSPWLSHVFLFDENRFILRRRPQEMS